MKIPKIIYLAGAIFLLLIGYLLTKPYSTLWQPVTALYSNSEYFCGFVELAKPYAYITYTLQNNGRLVYLRTVTNCDNIKTESPAVLGEEIKLFPKRDNPRWIKTSQGNIYEVKHVELTDDFKVPYDIFPVRVSSVASPDYFASKIANVSNYIRECKSLVLFKDRDTCLFNLVNYKSDICAQLQEDSSKNVCLQWVKNKEQRYWKTES